MALQTLKCPNCNGELQLDDKFEKGYCMYCGSAILIKDEVAKIKIEHSGKIEIDDSKKMSNAITLADRAFQAGNYKECYNYCCTALECDANNAHITFRKGLCAVRMSFERINELEQAVKSAIDIIKQSSEDIDNDIHVIFSEFLTYIRSMFALNCNRNKNFTYHDLPAANNAFSIIASLTRLCDQCAELITVEMMNANPKFEKDKKDCLELGLELCTLGTSSFNYVAGYTTSQPSSQNIRKATSPFLEMQKNYLKKFKNSFNNLPSTRKALLEFNGKIENLQKDIDAYNDGLAKYFKENPAIEKEYKKSALPLFIISIIIFFSGIVLIGNGNEYIGVAVVEILASFALGIWAIIRKIMCSKNRKKILSELPPELAALKLAHDESKTKLHSIEMEKSAFSQKNLKH